MCYVLMVVYWDGKLLPDITGKERVDRLPAILSGAGVEQLLGVPKIASVSGEAQAGPVKSCIDEWNLCMKIEGMCFDTMVSMSNTGRNAGACILIQRVGIIS